VIVTGKTKATITKLAKESGRTISREVEHLIERALQYEEMMHAMRNTLEEIEKGSVEAALVRLGYTPLRHSHEGKSWKLWAEPGYPGIEHSGFKSSEQGEAQ
jgi:hypothetical protein